MRSSQIQLPKPEITKPIEPTAFILPRTAASALPATASFGPLADSYAIEVS